MATKLVIEGSDNVTASQLKDFFRQISDGSITGYHLQKFLDHDEKPFQGPFNFLGSFKVGNLDKETLIERFLYKPGSRFFTDNQGKVIEFLRSDIFRIARKEEEILLVSISLKGLGFQNRALYEEVVDRAVGAEVQIKGEEYTLGLCSLEMGPQLRLQCLDQPTNETLIIVTEHDMYPDGTIKTFVVSNDGGVYGLYLHEREVKDHYFTYNGNQFVFTLKRNFQKK